MSQDIRETFGVKTQISIGGGGGGRRVGGGRSGVGRRKRERRKDMLRAG